jgi:hypothetical protein
MHETAEESSTARNSVMEHTFCNSPIESVKRLALKGAKILALCADTLKRFHFRVHGQSCY